VLATALLAVSAHGDDGDADRAQLEAQLREVRQEIELIQARLERALGDRARRSRGMPAILLEGHADEQPALVANRIVVPAAGLADDACGRSIAIAHVRGARRVRRFFAHRADDHQAGLAGDLCARGRNREGTQRPLGVDRAASPEHAVFDPDGDMTRHGVDVPEQHDLAGVGVFAADHAHGIARLVDVAA